MVSLVTQYLQSLHLIGMAFDQLETVELYGVNLSSELQFIKLLLASSPSLKLMIIYNMINDREEASRVSQELMRFPRASTTAEIIWKLRVVLIGLFWKLMLNHMNSLGLFILWLQNQRPLFVALEREIFFWVY
ncbi:hypothetical protein ACET3Z_012703 [Daucus carota]